MPSDLALLEADEPRKDLPCTVTARKPELGFDLRFHTGFDVNIPLKDLAGAGDILTVVFRVYPQADKSKTAFFVQHFRVPDIAEDAKGDAFLQGGIDVGQGNYHVDWLIRDRGERACSSTWETEAALNPKEKPMPLFIKENEIAESIPEPFVNDNVVRPQPARDQNVNVKLLVNFAPQVQGSASLERSDTEALVSILKTIQRDPRISRISLVAFNIDQTRVVYRQEAADQIDFPALGKALHNIPLGTVNLAQLSAKHSETDFLENLIEAEIGKASHPDAVIFAGPKAMLNADVPQQDLRSIGDIECPVFYLNYNLNPQAVPWKDSISHAIRVFKGTEYTISRPRDLWLSTSEMLSRIVRSKKEHPLATAISGGGASPVQPLH
ncbi:MAG: acetyltransferase [Acidobacteriia bacterium]|nr:acetyltransferase [Terriglobia bacterium]